MQRQTLGLTIDQGHPRSVSTACANAAKIAIKEFGPSYLQAFLNDFGGELIDAVVNRPMENMLNGTALIVGSTMLTDMLDTPIPKLAMGKGVNIR